MPRTLRVFRAYTNQISHYTYGEWQSVQDAHTCLQGLHKLFNIHVAPPLLSQPDLDHFFINGLLTSTCTSSRHGGPTRRYQGSLHAPFIYGVWHSGANLFLVFYIYLQFRTMINYPTQRHSDTHLADITDTTGT